MKLLLDMHISPEIARRLRLAGHDAFHLRERGLQEMSDPDIVRLAEVEERVIITFDIDFSTILATTRRSKPSVIQFRIGNARSEAVYASLVAVLMTYENELSGGCLLSVLPDRVRMRRLPFTPDRTLRLSEPDS